MWWFLKFKSICIENFGKKWQLTDEPSSPYLIWSKKISRINTPDPLTHPPPPSPGNSAYSICDGDEESVSGRRDRLLRPTRITIPFTNQRQRPLRSRFHLPLQFKSSWALAWRHPSLSRFPCWFNYGWRIPIHRLQIWPGTNPPQKNFTSSVLLQFVR